MPEVTEYCHLCQATVQITPYQTSPDYVVWRCPSGHNVDEEFIDEDEEM